MASSSSEPSNNARLFLLALGLLVGFVIGFIMLLSRLPVDTSLSDYHTTRVNGISSAQKPASDFEFYTVLAQQQGDRIEANIKDVTPAQTVIQPATRLVSGNVLNTSRRNLAAEDYAEIPASSIGQESYYLQAGSFSQPDEAERMRAAVLLLGFEAFIVKRQDVSGNLGHRVRIGPFFDQNRLTSAKKRLRRANVEYRIIRVTG